MSDHPSDQSRVIEQNQSAWQKIYAEAQACILRHQTSTGAITGPIIGEVDEGIVDPIAHVIATRGLLAAGAVTEAKQAVIFLLSCVRTESDLLVDRYRPSQEPDDDAMPSLDVSFELMIVVGEYLAKTGDRELVDRYLPSLEQLVSGLADTHHHRSEGMLIRAADGSSESEGFDLLTNARAVAAYRAAASWYHEAEHHQYLAQEYDAIAGQVIDGLLHHLRDPETGQYHGLLLPESIVAPVWATELEQLLLSWYTQLPIAPLTHERHEHAIAPQPSDEVVSGGGGLMMSALVRILIEGGDRQDELLTFVQQIAEHNTGAPMLLPEKVAPAAEITRYQQAAQRLEEVFPEESLSELVEAGKPISTPFGLMHYQANPSVAVLGMLLMMMHERFSSVVWSSG